MFVKHLPQPDWQPEEKDELHDFVEHSGHTFEHFMSSVSADMERVNRSVDVEESPLLRPGDASDAEVEEGNASKLLDHTVVRDRVLVTPRPRIAAEDQEWSLPFCQ